LKILPAASRRSCGLSARRTRRTTKNSNNNSVFFFVSFVSFVPSW